MGDSDITMYLNLLSLAIVVGAMIAFLVAWRLRSRIQRIIIGVLLLAMGIFSVSLSLLAALFVAGLGMAALVLGSATEKQAMTGLPAFRKHDRYKASSYRSYNFRMASRYDTCIWMRLCQTTLWDRTIVQELRQRPLIGSLRILDVGCATGRLLERLAQAGALQLCGTDLAPRILEVAAEKLSKTGISVDLRTADAEDRLPWEGDFFDVVTLTGVLHHFFRPKDALAEVRRVLRPGGRLLIIDPSFFTPVRQILNAALQVAPHDGDYRFYPATAAAVLLADVGFEVLRTRRVGWCAFLADGRKPGFARAVTGTEAKGAVQQRHAADGSPLAVSVTN